MSLLGGWGVGEWVEYIQRIENQEWQYTLLKARRWWSSAFRILEENHVSPSFISKLSMKCESRKNRVSLTYTLLMQSSLRSYLLEYAFIPSKQGDYPRKKMTWDPGNREVQEFTRRKVKRTSKVAAAQYV